MFDDFFFENIQKKNQSKEGFVFFFCLFVWMLSSFRLCQSLLVGHRYPISATMSSSPPPPPPPSGTDFSSSCKRDRPRVIATHSGSFHCDEALACWLLRRTPEFADASILRTRDPEKIAEADIAVDVGAEYDPARNRFDHHQRGFEETFSPQHSIKLSSAGLVYDSFIFDNNFF